MAHTKNAKSGVNKNSQPDPQGKLERKMPHPIANVIKGYRPRQPERPEIQKRENDKRKDEIEKKKQRKEKKNKKKESKKEADPKEIKKEKKMKKNNSKKKKEHREEEEGAEDEREPREHRIDIREDKKGKKKSGKAAQQTNTTFYAIVCASVLAIVLLIVVICRCCRKTVHVELVVKASGCSTLEVIAVSDTKSLTFSALNSAGHDVAFPPNKKSLFMTDAQRKLHKKEGNRDPAGNGSVTSWKTSKQVVGESAIVTGEITHKNPMQGGLGDCWLISAMSALAAHPENALVKRIFPNPSTVDNAYAVCLFVDGEWCNVMVDDYFPCKQNRLAYTSGNDSQLWPIILEKAMAKRYGCYESLGSGYSCDALRASTGFPTETIWHVKNNIGPGPGKHDDLWATLWKLWNERCVMTASPKRNTDAKNSKLAVEHTYSIIDMKQKGALEMIRLRNPWGQDTTYDSKLKRDVSHAYCGPWDKNSNEWSKDLLEYFEYQPALENGEFWIPIKHFFKIFNEVTVCYPQKSHVTCKVAFNSKGNAKSFKVKLTTKWTYLTIDQQDKRKPGAPNHFDVNVFILNETGDVVYNTGSDTRQTATYKTGLPAGTYTVIPFCSAVDGVPYPFINMNLYSDGGSIEVTEEDKNYDQSMYQDLFIKTVMHYSTLRPEKKADNVKEAATQFVDLEWKNKDKNNGMKYTTYEFESGHSYFYCIKNRSQTQLTIKKFQTYQCSGLRPISGLGKVNALNKMIDTFTIEPDQTVMVIACQKSIVVTNSGRSVKFSIRQKYALS